MDRPEDFFYKISSRERSIFECGIKLAMAYHQFVGTPISDKNAEALEKAIEGAIRNQPYVEDVTVKIPRKSLKLKKGFGYASLDGKMLDISVTIKFKGARCKCRMKNVSKMDFPLMYVEKVEDA